MKSAIGSHHAQADRHEGPPVYLDHPPAPEELQLDDVGAYWNREFLYKLYVVDGLTTREIAEQLGLSRRTVAYWIERHGISDGRGKVARFEQALSAMDPDDLGEPTPDGDDRWKARYGRG